MHIMRRGAVRLPNRCRNVTWILILQHPAIVETLHQEGGGGRGVSSARTVCAFTQEGERCLLSAY